MVGMEPGWQAGSACGQRGFKDNILLNGLGHGRRNLGFGIARHPSSYTVSGRVPIRALVTAAALAAGIALTGCNSDEISLANNAKANQPVPPKLVADMAAKDMDLNSPILVR